jgi:hypothetical protein
MVEAKFKQVLTQLDKSLQRLLADHKSKIVFPDPNDERYDLGQSEVLWRAGSIEDYLKHADDGCEACAAGIDSDIHQARQTIAKYLQGQLTDPEVFYTATYLKQDKTAASSILYQTGEAGISVKSTKTDFTDILQKAIDTSNDSKTLPLKVGDYELHEAKSGETHAPKEVVLFKQERTR